MQGERNHNQKEKYTKKKENSKNFFKLTVDERADGSHREINRASEEQTIDRNGSDVMAHVI